MSVMVLKKVENGLERIFERTLSRPFKNALQPIEIGTRIVREIDLTRRLSTQGPLSPNVVRVWLSPADAAAFRRIPEGAGRRARRDRASTRPERGIQLRRVRSRSRSSSTTT